MSTTPEALRLAELLGMNIWTGKQGPEVWAAAAVELRRLAQVEQYAETLNARCIEDTAELGKVRAEAERTARNRDMWKAQCERQASELEALRADAAAYKEGSEQAFGDVVDQKRTLEADLIKIEENLRRCHAIIREKAAELEALRRGEFVCGKCGLRKDAEAAGPVPF